jgi:hypothetical protein
MPPPLGASGSLVETTIGLGFANAFSLVMSIASLMSPSKSKMIDDGDGDDAAAADDDDAAVRTTVRRSLVRTTVWMSMSVDGYAQPHLFF